VFPVLIPSSCCQGHSLTRAHRSTKTCSVRRCNKPKHTATTQHNLCHRRLDTGHNRRSTSRYRRSSQDADGRYSRHGCLSRGRSRDGSRIRTDRQPTSFGRFDLFHLYLRLGLCSRVHLNAADLPRRSLVERHACERHGCLPTYFWMCWVCEYVCCASGFE
jgi:hypothetical protein